MLVFGFLKRRKFQKGSKTMQKTMLRVCYTFLGCALGIFALHAFRAIYTQRGYLFARSTQWSSYTTESGRVKVQIPTFFVCGCRTTDW